MRDRPINCRKSNNNRILGFGIKESVFNDIDYIKTINDINDDNKNNVKLVIMSTNNNNIICNFYKLYKLILNKVSSACIFYNIWNEILDDFHDLYDMSISELKKYYDINILIITYILKYNLFDKRFFQELVYDKLYSTIEINKLLYKYDMHITGNREALSQNEYRMLYDFKDYGFIEYMCYNRLLYTWLTSDYIFERIIIKSINANNIDFDTINIYLAQCNIPFDNILEYLLDININNNLLKKYLYLYSSYHEITCSINFIKELIHDKNYKKNFKTLYYFGFNVYY